MNFKNLKGKTLEVNGKIFEYKFQTEVKAPPEEVWNHASTMAGVNRELSPLIRMTFPRVCEILCAETMERQGGSFTSWIFLFGILPVDRWKMRFEEFGPGFRFLERSKVISLQFWEHERTVFESNGGSLICDRIKFIPKVRLLGPIVAFIMIAVFRNRHRNLKKIFKSTFRMRPLK